MADRLRVALVGGPMYDSVYEPFIDDVEVVVHADHPTLNRRVAELLGNGERIDVLSTHGKYAPSQAEWLRPLDDIVDSSVFAQRAVSLCSFDGHLLCAPRNIDVRTLWWRTDRMNAPPDTWADLAARDTVFGFTGRESGLFGLFFELVTGHGGDLFDADSDMIREEAVEFICNLAKRAPTDLSTWHYDEVDAALLDGRVDCAAAWPGGFARIRESKIYGALAPALYPAGPMERVSYSGVHGWAIPNTCGYLDGAIALLQRLNSPEIHEREAAAGGIPARTDVLDALEPVDATDGRRLAITRDTIDNAMITYPPLANFPEIEDAGWGAIHDAIVRAIES